MTEDEELELFTIKTRFFREIPHPKLILKAIAQVEKKVNVRPSLHSSDLDFNQVDLAAMLKLHSEKIHSLKTVIAHANKPEDLFIALNELYRWQWSLILHLKTYLPVKTAYPDQEIKQSDHLDSYTLLKFIHSAGLSENQIKTYICTEIEERKPEEFSVLTKACLQCRKIFANVGSNESSEGTVG